MKASTYITRMSILAISLFMASCNQGKKFNPPKGFENLPAPKIAYSELRNPDPVAQNEQPAPQSVQLGNHGFLFYTGNKPLQGAFTAEGEVLSFSNKEIVVKTTDKAEIAMRYALPGDLQLPVKKGDRISIRYQPKFYANSRGYILVNQSGDQLLHSSAKISGSDTLRVEIAKGIYIFQELNKKAIGEKSDFGTLTQIPARLVFNRNNISLTTGKATEVDYNGAKYTVMILASMRMQPTEQKQASAEGDNYVLEYALVKK